jgi:hypothetical protein
VVSNSNFDQILKKSVVIWLGWGGQAPACPLSPPLSPGHTPSKALPGATDYSKAEYTNTQQDLLVGDNYFTNSRHDRIFGQWVSFAEK